MKHALAFITALSLLSGCAKPEAPPSPAEQKAPVAAAKMPSPEEMQKIMVEASTPGEEHARLNAIVGTWKAETKMWMDPGAKPEIGKGNSKAKWVLGKRYVQEEFTGKFMGQAFQGIGITGYDNTKKEYFSTWIDTMGTGLMKSEGTFDAAKSEIEMRGTFFCPMTKSEHHPRTVLRIINKNEHVLEMYDAAPNGQEMKIMEITYKRIS